MTLKVGIAGYGLAGRFFHAPLLKGCGFEVAGVLTTKKVKSTPSKADLAQQMHLEYLKREPCTFFRRSIEWLKIQHWGIQI